VNGNKNWSFGCDGVDRYHNCRLSTDNTGSVRFVFVERYENIPYHFYDFKVEQPKPVPNSPKDSDICMLI
jgi:hypothetical protein